MPIRSSIKVISFIFTTLIFSVPGYAQSVSSSNSGFLSMPSSPDIDGISGLQENDVSDVSDANEGRIRDKLSRKRRRFHISPYAGASVTYSDNVGLVSDSDITREKEDGMIYNGSVGLNANYQSKRLDAVAGVDLTYLNRSNDTDEIIPSGRAGVSTELLPNTIFLDTVGSVTGLRNNARSANALSGASNDDYDLYLQGTISPYIRHQFGRLMVGELRYGYDYGGGTADTIGQIQSHTYTGKLGTSTNGGRININGSVSYTDISVDNEEFNTNINLPSNNDSTQLTAEVSATYALSSRLSLTGQVGVDDIGMADQAYGDELSGVFYNAGLQYMPSERLRMSARIGQRNDTLYYLADGNYNLTKQVYIGATAISQLSTAIPLGALNNALAPGTLLDQAIEGETIASQLGDTLPGATVSNNDSLNVLGNQQNRQLFRSQSVNAYAGVQLRNDSFGVLFGFEHRNYNRAQNEVIKSVTANYRHNFTRQASLTIEGFYSDLDSILENSNQTYGARLLANYALNNNVNIFASIGRNQREADISDQFSFTEHNISAGVSTQF